MGAKIAICCTRPDQRDRHDVDGFLQQSLILDTPSGAPCWTSIDDMPLFMHAPLDGDERADMSQTLEKMDGTKMGGSEHDASLLDRDALEQPKVHVDAENESVREQNLVEKNTDHDKKEATSAIASTATTNSTARQEDKMETPHENDRQVAGLLTSYKGSFSHETFGDKSIDIVVQLKSSTTGSWSAFGKSKDISVTWTGDHIVLDDGMTKLEGARDAQGNLAGYVMQEGVKGGSFVLKVQQSKAGAKTKPTTARKKDTVTLASYTGRFMHPTFGEKDIDIVVHMTGATGRWEALKKAKEISVVWQGDQVVMSDGMTQLDGVRDAKGNLKGDVIQEGVRGGYFNLKPKKEKKPK